MQLLPSLTYSESSGVVPFPPFRCLRIGDNFTELESGKSSGRRPFATLHSATHQFSTYSTYLVPYLHYGVLLLTTPTLLLLYYLLNISVLVQSLVHYRRISDPLG